MSMIYLRWIRTPRGFVSTCSRFVIMTHSRKEGYLGLTDLREGKEYVCRSADSAKTAARNIMKLGTTS